MTPLPSLRCCFFLFCFVFSWKRQTHQFSITFEVESCWSELSASVKMLQNTNSQLRPDQTDYWTDFRSTCLTCMATLFRMMLININYFEGCDVEWCWTKFDSHQTFVPDKVVVFNNVGWILTVQCKSSEAKDWETTWPG